MAVPLRDAATVLPLRNRDGALEIFVVRRNSRLGFAAGATVFPGGAVDDADHDDAFASLLVGVTGEQAAQSLRLDDAARARAHFVAAARELFEEAAVLLACDNAGGKVAGKRIARDHDEIDVVRNAIAVGERGFADYLGEAGVCLAGHRLRYCAHYLTPVVEKRRFDTRFFVARVPDDQDARHDRGETTAGAWVRPESALARYRNKEIELFPPTIVMLEWLAEFRDADAALDAAADFAPTPNLPIFTEVDGDMILLFADDPEHAADPESDFSAAAGSERIANAPARGTRMIFRDGLWEWL